MVKILLLVPKSIEYKMRALWSQSSGVFINIIFAALFLGENIEHKYILELTFK